MVGMMSQRADLMSGTAMTPPRPRIEGTLSPRPSEEAPNVSEDEQAEYDAFVTAGYKLLYEGGKVRPGILEMLDDDPADLVAALGEQEGLDLERFGPVVALGATAAVVVLELVRQAEEKPDGAILLHGGQAILEDIAEIAIKAGIREFDQAEVNQAALVAMDFYRAAAEAEGLYDPAAAEEDMAELKQANEEGRFLDVVPQLRQFATDGAPNG